MLALFHEILGHGAAGVWRDVLQGSRIAGAGHDHRGVVHRPLLAKGLDQPRHRRFLLADGHVEALYVGVLLVDDRVDADGRLAGLAVADDQLALSASDGSHRVDCLDAGLQGLIHRLALGHAVCDHLDGASLGGGHRAGAVQGVSQRVDYPAQHRLAHRHAQQPAGAADLVALVDLEKIAEDNHTHRVLFEVEGQAEDVAGKLDHLARHHSRQPVHPGNPISHLDYPANFANVDPGFEPFNFLLNH